jgi:hypothetical protein
MIAALIFTDWYNPMCGGKTNFILFHCFVRPCVLKGMTASGIIGVQAVCD